MFELFNFLRRNLRWVGAGFLLTFFSAFGQTFFISLSGAEIRQEFDLSHGEFGGLYMLATLASAATLPLLGRIVDHISVARTCLIILPGLAIACTSMATAQSVYWLALSLYLLRLFGQGMMTHTAFTAMGRWYSSQRGKAVSLVTIGHQFGEASLPLIVIIAFAVLGWRQTWLSAALLLAVVALPAIYFLVHNDRQPQSQLPDEEQQPTAPSWSLRQVLRDKYFWPLICVVMAPSFISTTLFFHQAYLLEIKDWSEGAFASAFVLLAIVTIAASLLTGQLVDRYSAIKLLPFCLLPLGLGCFAIWGIQAQFAVFLLMALIGCSQGMSSVLYGALWPELYGTKHLGAIRSSITALMVLSSALGPGLTGWLIDSGVDYLVQIAVMGIYCAFGSAAMVLVRKQLSLRQQAA